ncbi:hypothetical protein CC80DRAFT_354141, partial [Byssothecium circinans]
GEIIHTGGGRKLTRIHPNILVKSGRDLDLGEVDMMNHIHRFSKSFPSPRSLGSIICNSTTHFFMTFIEGSTLEALWPSLSTDLKSSARDQLSKILLDLRSLPLLSAQYGGGTPPRCKDVRRSVRRSSEPIDNEQDFNEFLLSTTKPWISQSYKEHVRSKCLGSHHRIVLTHGDFHPRNILAELREDSLVIRGVVDWEAGGSYPEYWEYIKCLNTVSSVDEDDWLRYVPICGMGEYSKEWAVDMLLES